jgi:Rad/Gem-related GTP binding protein 1
VYRHSNHSNLSGVSPGERSPFEGSCCGSSYNNMSSDASVEEIAKYRVVLLGDAGVGKTALVSQFMTSEYMNTYDASLGKYNCYSIICPTIQQYNICFEHCQLR